MPNAPAPAEENPASTPIGNSQPRQPARILFREIPILGAGDKSNAGGSSEQEPEQNYHDRTIRVATENAQNVSAEQETRNRAQRKQPQVAAVDVASREIEGRGNQPQYARKNESGTHRRFRREADDQNQRGNCETAATNSRKTDRERDQETDQDVHQTVRLDSVWIPHSSLAPPQRPERGSAPAAGIAVHGSQPMLRYPES